MNKNVEVLLHFIEHTVPSNVNGGGKKSKNKSEIQALFKSEALTKLVKMILVLNIPNENQLKLNIISTSGIQEIDRLFNTAKISVM